MKFSRVVIGSNGSQLSYSFDPDVAVVDGDAEESGQIASVLESLFLGVTAECRIFATIDGIEFEIREEMVPLIGDRLGGEFGTLDLAAAPPLDLGASGWIDAEALAVRAALENVGAIPKTTNVEQVDHALAVIGEQRRSRTELLQLERLGRALLDRKNQLRVGARPTPKEHARAAMTLRDLLRTTLSRPDESAAAVARLSGRDVTDRATEWLAAQHERQLAPLVKQRCNAHAAGANVLGAIPVVLDLRNVEGVPSAANALTTAFRNHRRRTQFIVFAGDQANREWISAVSAPAIH